MAPETAEQRVARLAFRHAKIAIAGVRKIIGRNPKAIVMPDTDVLAIRSYLGVQAQLRIDGVVVMRSGCLGEPAFIIDKPGGQWS